MMNKRDWIELAGFMAIIVFAITILGMPWMIVAALNGCSQ